MTTIESRREGRLGLSDGMVFRKPRALDFLTASGFRRRAQPS